MSVRTCDELNEDIRQLCLALESMQRSDTTLQEMILTLEKTCQSQDYQIKSLQTQIETLNKAVFVSPLN